MAQGPAAIIQVGLELRARRTGLDGDDPGLGVQVLHFGHAIQRAHHHRVEVGSVHAPGDRCSSTHGHHRDSLRRTRGEHLENVVVTRREDHGVG